MQKYPVVVNQNNESETIQDLVPNTRLGLSDQSFFAPLANCSSVTIKQRASCAECNKPFLIPNLYHVYAEGNTNLELYEIKEKSSCIERYCVFTYRGFEMKIRSVPTMQYHENSIAVKATKECGIYTFCNCGCGKPKIITELVVPTFQAIGSVHVSYQSCLCALCEAKIQIFDASNNLRYAINRNCYCIGCYCCCAKCCSILYNITDDKGEKVGQLEKLSCDGLGTCCPKADNYSIRFPPNATPGEKMLLIVGALLLDFVSFFY
jgi:hypothetical protein